MIDDYLNEFLDEEDPELVKEEKRRPEWVSDANSSAVAYEAIQRLFKRKRMYINGHKKRSDYVKKSLYQISKSEVASEVGVKMQPIFYTVGYATQLTLELNEKNEKLATAKDNAIKSPGSGNNQKTKKQLVKELNETTERDEVNSKRTVEDVYAKTLERIPLDVKKAFKLV